MHTRRAPILGSTPALTGRRQPTSLLLLLALMLAEFRNSRHHQAHPTLPRGHQPASNYQHR
eukprot:1159943-Pelagomonas_calceolata.AAC.4